MKSAGIMFLGKHTASFAVVNVVILCLLVSEETALHHDEITAEVAGLDFQPVVLSATEEGEDLNEIAHQETTCDCGPGSTGCKLEKGTKVCECKYKYRQENGVCKAWCKDYYNCKNGAQCVNESCQCLPGTRGDFCDTIDECDGIKGPIMCGDPDKVYCDYDAKTQKPTCRCRILDFIYYPKIRGCIECDCGKFGSCSLIDGKKTCKCNEGAALRQVEFWGDIVDRCVVCNCGNNSDKCSYEGMYTKVCKCKEGFAQQPDLYGEMCNVCTCGPHGQCYFTGWYKNCNCDEGYRPFVNLNRTELTCEECDCGKNGKCSFDKEVKQCNCNPGYAEREGICTACQCYADDKVVDCTFTNKTQNCLCPDGYENSKMFCKDINECLNSSHSCPRSSTDCVNTMGSYECACKDGYEPMEPGSNPKIDGCKDIDECRIPELCPSNHTICDNLPGSYSCVCEKGFVPISPHTSAKEEGCEQEGTKNTDKSSAWGIALIILGVIFCVCIVVIITVIFIKRRSTDRTTMGMNSLH